MEPTLNMTASLGAYNLADRGTWLSFKNRQDLEVLFAGDAAIFNPYGIMLVNPAKYPAVKQQAGMKFIDWIVGPAGQAAIAEYKIGGEPCFFPSAAKYRNPCQATAWLGKVAPQARGYRQRRSPLVGTGPPAL
jgi:tungstate transport system substrate-binding protein